jgi:hypothetical protein
MQTSLAQTRPTSPTPPAPPVAPTLAPSLTWFSTALIVVCGILLPATTLLVEALTHMCADGFFDPLPTVGHVFAIAAVPLAGVVSLWVLKRRDAARIEAVIFAQAFAVAISGVYAVIFAPMTPVAAFGVMCWGLGLLPLSPLLSLMAGLRALTALRRLRRDAGLPAHRAILGGLAAGVGLLIALNIPATLTRVMLVRAASDDPAVSRSGIAWLRRLGQRDLMLRAASSRARGGFDLASAALDVFAPIPYDKTREIYYRVTGRPIEAEPAPRVGSSLPGRRHQDDARWDVNQGADQVGVIAWRGLSLRSSRFDGSVDARAAVAYVEWTFELKNDAPVPREARAELALPPGGVVSRVTLWIDGQEHEAAFAGRDLTRRAYQRVVGARRDPILVTASAPDRILVQCFPVLPDGGVMKARIGITAPLQLTGRGAGTLGLPYITQRNFDVPAAVTHAVWIASKDAFAPPAPPLIRELVTGGEDVRGQLAEPTSPVPFAAVTVQRPAAITTAWTPERAGKDVASRDAIVRQTLRAVTAQPPSRLVVVVDGGAAMKTAGPVLAAALRTLPAGVPVAIEIAGDEVEDLLGGVVAVAAEDVLAARLRATDFAGGTDALPALAAAWDLAAAAPRGAVLWIHGPQAMVLAPTDELRQRMERRRDGPIIYTYAAIGGENRLLSNLGDLPSFKAVPRYLPGMADLEAFLRGLGGREERVVAVRTREVNVHPGALDGVETSDHLARLWAFDRIDALMHPASRTPPSAADQKEALALAARYHLVTGVSGAVVLESQGETDAVAASESERSSVPTVPEPETWALLALVAALLLATLRSRRRLVARTS